MINLKEKKLLVKMNAALGRPSDPLLLEEIEQEEARLKQEQEKYNALMEKQSKKIGAAFADLTKDISKLISEEKKKTKEEELILERFSNILTQISQHKPSDIQPIVEDVVFPVNEPDEVPVTESVTPAPEPIKPKSLVDVVVEKVSSTSTPSVFVQPDPPLVERDIQAIQQKLKMLEGWLSKVSMAGPGGGAVWLRDLDDVSRTIKDALDGQVLTFNAATNKWVATTPSINGASGNTSQLYAYVTNDEDVTIHKGDPVYLHRATGNRPSVKQAYNTSDAYSAKTMGLAAEDIPAHNPGWVIARGLLTGVNTSAYPEGDTLYLGSTPGTLTNVKPYAPNHLVYMGVVVRANQGQGQIYVQPQNGYELEELHNVNINHNVVLANGHTLIYNASNQLWENGPLPAGTKGDKGDTGTSGTNGVAGAKGDTGLKGDVGPAGTTGATGSKGDKGDTGTSGTKGDKGDVPSTYTYITTSSIADNVATLTSNNALNLGGVAASNFVITGLDTYLRDVTLRDLTSSSVTANAATAFIAGIAANSGVALQMPHEGALRNMSTTPSTMYFDVNNGGSAHGNFNFRSSNNFTSIVNLNVSQVTFNSGAAISGQTPYAGRTSFNVALDTVVTVDNIKYRISNQSGVFPQIASASGSTVDVCYDVLGIVNGASPAYAQNSGYILLANGTWLSIYSAHGMDSRGDRLTAHVTDKAAGKIYRATFMKTNNSSNADGYNIVVERII